MAATRRKPAVPSRRRRHDDGEEEGSFHGDVDDDSLSEGSVVSNGEDEADVEGSDVSADEEEESHTTTEARGLPLESSVVAESQPKKPAEDSFKTTAETDAMLNGLKTSGTIRENQEMQFDELGATHGDSQDVDTTTAESTRKETPAERNRREHLEYLKEKNANPAFVPTRGGFFLHDNRSTPLGTNTFRSSIRGRGRGPYGGGVYAGRGNPIPEPTEQKWTHDLHDTVDNNVRATPPSSTMVAPKELPHRIPAMIAPPPSAPNRSFSVSTALGNVTVRILLPGMTKPVSKPNVVKMHHTLLPQHRPPLRRDKPVRISLPDQAPRYIFPSTERSFIFIPRALRPNQPAFTRGRGRGSFHGSRRTSMFGGSTYSPSAGMSRKSSIGGLHSGDDLRSPVTALPRQPGIDLDPTKPVVRLPPAPYAIPIMPQPPNWPGNGVPLNGNAAYSFSPPPPTTATREMQLNPLPMHQPRPQKTVSVADIESPASFTFKPPEQQQEQPFHQQVPRQVSAPPLNEEPSALSTQPRQQPHLVAQAGTPLSQIPERAIYAQPFQPYPMLQPQGFYPAPYAPGTLFYPPMHPEGMVFNGQMASSVMAPNFVPGSHPTALVLGLPPSAAEGAAQMNLVAHESNGMVYYYDPAQMPPASQANTVSQFAMGPAGGVIGMGGMMTPPAHFYYPPAPSSMYFAPQ